MGGVEEEWYGTKPGDKNTESAPGRWRGEPEGVYLGCFGGFNFGKLAKELNRTSS
jgi:hypothetical protein